MALPCCDLCYEKYLRRGGRGQLVLEKQDYEAAIQRSIEWGRLRERPREVCGCECHVKGENVLH